MFDNYIHSLKRIYRNTNQRSLKPVSKTYKGKIEKQKNNKKQKHPNDKKGKNFDTYI